MTRRAGGRRRGRAPGCEALEDRRLLAVSLAFDYSLDSSGFFSASRRGLLESTLNAIASRFADSLAAVPTQSYELNTASGSRSVTTSSPANVIKVYAYGRPLGGSTAGQGGAYYSTGMRGQGANDFAPDITYMMFDDDGSTNWFFGSTTSGLTGSQIDFVTVARHEFLHALGFINQPSFAANTQGSTFVGANAVAANGGAGVPLEGQHVARSIPSVMNSVTWAGQRSDLGELEWAMLRDIGWSLAATPSGFERGLRLFTGGEGDGVARAKVIPSRGVHLMALDALAGDTLRLRTLDGSTADERGVDSYLKLFDASGNLIFADDDSAGGGKEDVTYTFSTGGRYWVGAGTHAQRDFTFARPSSAAVASTAYYLEATLTGRGPDEPSHIADAVRPIAFPGGRFATSTTLIDAEPDVYRIDAIAGATYVVTTSLPAGGGLAGPARAAIYDASGRKVAGSTGAPFGSLSWAAPATASYYVQVSRDAGAAVIATDDGGISVGGGFTTLIKTEDGAASCRISGDRTSGSDYALTITQALPQPPRSVEPLYVDYGQNGLWRWTEAGGWLQINKADPQDIAVAADGSLFVDYGEFGLWRWTASTGIIKINGANPQAMTPGADGSLFIDYGQFGLWRWTAGSSLKQINGADPRSFAAGTSGELFVDYGPFGLWVWRAGSSLRRINTVGPEGMSVGADGTLHLDYGPSGIWTYSAAGRWAKLHANNPEGIAAGPGGVLYIDFGRNGLWLRTAAGQYHLLNSSDARGLVVGADGWLFIDFGQFGVWRWSSVGGFQKIRDDAPQRLAVRSPALRP